MREIRWFQIVYPKWISASWFLLIAITVWYRWGAKVWITYGF